MRKIIILLVLISSSLLWSNTVLLEEVMGATGKERNLKLLKEVKGSDNEELLKGIIYHNISTEDLDPQKIEKSIQLLKNYYNKSENPIALCYWGSALAIRSSYEFNNSQVIKSLDSLGEGLKLIDKSIDLDRKNIDLRFIRLIIGVEVSEESPINRDKTIKSDIKFFDKNSKKLSKDNVSQYLYYKARYLILRDEIDGAIKSLEKAIKVSPNSIYAGYCEELLLDWEE